MTTTLTPGINLPAIPYTPKDPTLFAKTVTAQADGTLTFDDVGGGRASGGYAHAMLFPSWSKGTIGYFAVPEGETVQVRATAANELTVISRLGEVTYTDMVLVVFHNDLDREAVTGFYSSEMMQARAREDWVTIERLEQEGQS